MTHPDRKSAYPAAPSHPGLTGGPIYLDYNATTPVDPRVTAAVLPHLTHHFGNPSSSHAYGQPAHAALTDARARVAALIGAAPDHMVFTGSGSEADTLAIRGTVLAALDDDPRRWTDRRPHVITQSTEHPAVLHACAALQRLHGIRVTYLPVDTEGLVHPDRLADALTDETVLVSIMHANNETGVIQPIADLAALAHAVGALFHTDAAQTVAKIPVDVNALDIDLLTLVGHKMYAPKGIAALYVRDGIRLEPLVPGGGQERGLRAGTENVALAVGLGAAADLAAADLANDEQARLTTLRDRLHAGLSAALPGRVHLNGHATHRLPHTANLSIDAGSAEALLAALPGLAASTGSACHTGHTDPSPVLTAMHLDPARAAEALRLSLGRWTTDTDIDHAVQMLSTAARSSGQPAATIP